MKNIEQHIDTIENREKELLLSLKNLDKEKVIAHLKAYYYRMIILKWMKEYKAKYKVTFMGISKCFKSIVFDKFIEAEKDFFEDEKELKAYMNSKFFKKTLKTFITEDLEELKEQLELEKAVTEELKLKEGETVKLKLEEMELEELKLEEAEMEFKAYLVSEVLKKNMQVTGYSRYIKIDGKIYSHYISTSGTSVIRSDIQPNEICKRYVNQKYCNIRNNIDLHYIKEDINKKIDNIENSINLNDTKE